MPSVVGLGVLLFHREYGMSLTFPWGTWYEFGMKNVCDVPLSSSHSQRNVPMETLTVLDPANPFIVRVLGFNRPTKLDLIWDSIHSQ